MAPRKRRKRKKNYRDPPSYAYYDYVDVYVGSGHVPIKIEPAFALLQCDDNTFAALWHPTFDSEYPVKKYVMFDDNDDINIMVKDNKGYIYTGNAVAVFDVIDDEHIDIRYVAATSYLSPNKHGDYVSVVATDFGHLNVLYPDASYDTIQLSQLPQLPQDVAAKIADIGRNHHFQCIESKCIHDSVQPCSIKFRMYNDIIVYDKDACVGTSDDTAFLHALSGVMKTPMLRAWV